MADSACYIELASNAGDFFTNSALDDIMIRPKYATQNILIGTSNSAVSTLTITSNSVGLQNNNPIYPLDVNGAARFQGAVIGGMGYGGTYAGFAHSNSANQFRYSLLSEGGTGNTFINCSPGSKLSFRESNIEKMVLSNANLGVGVSNPNYKIDVAGDVNVTGVYRQNNTVFRSSQWTSAFSNVYIGANSNVGIGTNNPSQRLHVIGNARIEGNLDVNGIYNTINTDVQVTDQITISNDGTGPGLVVIQMGAQPIADFYDDSNIALRIADGGLVGIGTSSPQYPLHVNGNIFATGDIGCISDIRAKSNLEVIRTPLQKVSQINGYTYDFIDTKYTRVERSTKVTSRFTGIIAQELEKVLPEAVHKDQNGFLSIAYGNVAGLLVEAIKEIDSKYCDKIAALEKEVIELKKTVASFASYIG